MSIAMDLSGSLDSYKETGRVFKIFKYGQSIDFETAVFKESLQVYLISGGLTTLLEEDVDYRIPDTFVTSCDNDTSRAKIMDPEFSKELISGIQMIRGVEQNDTYTVSVSFQRLYPNQVRMAYFQNEPLNVTPELMMDIVNSIEKLHVLTSGVSNVGALTETGSIVLELDTDKTNPNNFITEEEHVLDVSKGKYIIHPKGGSFYADSIAVTHKGTGMKLVKDKDYFILGMNEAKTKATSHTSPVYDFILVATTIVGTVSIDYHAFGGEPTIDNYRELAANYNNIIQFLNNNKSVTEETLGSTPVLTSLFERIASLEENMRRLQGTPAYGDMTSGKCILMKLFSDKPGLHWYTIASLYAADGSDMKPCGADTFMFRLQSQISHFQFTAAVSVDIANREGDCLNVNVISENYPRGYTPFTEYGSIDRIIRPQLRVVWNESSNLTGAYLQLGFTLTNMLEETISIEDMSGHESCWKLVPEVAAAVTPSDSDFVLPNGVSIWSDTLDTSKQESMLMPFRKGHLAWAGSQSMNRPDDGWQLFEITNDVLLDPETDISKITRLRLDIEEVDGFQFPVDIPFNSKTASLKGHASFTHGNLPAYVNAEIYRDSANAIKIRLNYDVTAGTTSNELKIRDVVVYLD